MVQPYLWGTSLPQVDLLVLALSTLVGPRHPSASLGQHDSLVAARDFSLLLCVGVGRMGLEGWEGVHYKQIPSHNCLVIV